MFRRWHGLLAPAMLARTPLHGTILGLWVGAVGAGIRMLCNGWLHGEYAFLMAYPAVTVATVLAGDIGGLVATVVGAALPILMHWIDPATSKGATALGVYVASGLLITALFHRVQQTRLQLDAAYTEAAASKNEFLARVSHELRTPLNVAMGRLAMVLQQPNAPAAQQRTMLEAALRNLRSTHTLVNDLIEISKVTVSPQLDLVFLPLDLAALLQSLVADASVTARNRGVEVDLQLAVPIAWVMGDEERLRQIFGNLVNNAVKFTVPPGCVYVRLSTPSKRAYAVSVLDGGVGIAPEDLPHIFDPFRQGGPAHHRDNKGLGLGLAIVKQLTEAHGGAVRALSGGRGKGAVFTVTLPAAEAHPRGVVGIPVQRA